MASYLPEHLYEFRGWSLIAELKLVNIARLSDLLFSICLFSIIEYSSRIRKFFMSLQIEEDNWSSNDENSFIQVIDVIEYHFYSGKIARIKLKWQ